jgi:HEAT repeat protein
MLPLRPIRPAAVLAMPVLLCPLALLAPGCDSFQDARGAEGLLDVMFQPTTPEDAVEDALDDFDPDRRYRGTAQLANAPWAGEEAYLRLYEDAAVDPDAGVREVAARALGIHGTPEHVPLLVTLLEDEEWLVRREAARSLQRLHGEEAIVPLMERVDIEIESVAAVRAEAAHALGQFPEERVVQALIKALQDPSLAVNHNTVLALEFLTGQNLGYEPADWLAWLDETDRPFVAGRVYTYPGFERDKMWYEYLPFLPPPPYEAESIPVGLAGNRAAEGS